MAITSEMEKEGETSLEGKAAFSWKIGFDADETGQQRLADAYEKSLRHATEYTERSAMGKPCGLSFVLPDHAVRREDLKISRFGNEIIIENVKEQPLTFEFIDNLLQKAAPKTTPETAEYLAVAQVLIVEGKPIHVKPAIRDANSVKAAGSWRIELDGKRGSEDYRSELINIILSDDNFLSRFELKRGDLGFGIDRSSAKGIFCFSSKKPLPRIFVGELLARADENMRRELEEDLARLKTTVRVDADVAQAWQVWYAYGKTESIEQYGKEFSRLLYREPPLISLRNFGLTGDDIKLELDLPNRCIHVMGDNGKEIPRKLVEMLVRQAYSHVFHEGIAAIEAVYQIDAERRDIKPRGN